jgi:hypothetical protein
VSLCHPLPSVYLNARCRVFLAPDSQTRGAGYSNHILRITCSHFAPLRSLLHWQTTVV